MLVLTLLVISIGQVAADVPPSERTVLMALYDSTGGDRWSNRSGWGSAQPVCDWYGVRCDFVDGSATRPVVVGLSLAENNLEGELPSSLSDLGHLKFLSVPLNRLRGRLPEGLLERWDRHAFEINASGNEFANVVVRVNIEYSAAGVLCSPIVDLRYRVELDEINQRARLQSIRCADTESRTTYCLVREGTPPALLRLSRGLKSLGFVNLQPAYNFPFTGMTHGVLLTTEAVWGDGAKTSVRTYARQGPIEVWSAQQLFMGLIPEAGWERESRKPTCDFEK